MTITGLANTILIDAPKNMPEEPDTQIDLAASHVHIAEFFQREPDKSFHERMMSTSESELN